MAEQPLTDDELIAVRKLVPIADKIVSQTSTGGMIVTVESAITSNPKMALFLTALATVLLSWLAGVLKVPVPPLPPVEMRKETDKKIETQPPVIPVPTKESK
jgi:hypothetical protein